MTGDAPYGLPLRGGSGEFVAPGGSRRSANEARERIEAADAAGAVPNPRPPNNAAGRSAVAATPTDVDTCAAGRDACAVGGGACTDEGGDGGGEGGATTGGRAAAAARRGSTFSRRTDRSRKS